MSSLKPVKLRTIETGEAVASVVLDTPPSKGLGNVLTGEVTMRTPDGRISVDYPLNERGPLQAKTLVEDLPIGSRVLLTFENGDPAKPIVLGVVYDRCREDSGTISLKARRIVLEAHDELLMRCGECSLRAQRNGKINVKGRDVITRASRTNKVRGATVSIN